MDFPLPPSEEEAPSSERFEIRGRLGDGSMGIVFDAYDRERGETVAIKTVRAPSADAILRFKDEFRALADLHHENLVQLGELFEDRGRFYFTMERIDGTDFVSWVRSGSTSFSVHEADGPGAHDDIDDEPTVTAVGLDLARLRAALIQLARAVQAVHAAGQVHRDLKPSNVRVTREGRVVVLDFGLSTTSGVDGSWNEADIVGTPTYMAPEQAAAQPALPSADWYAVGVMLYEALTGGLPFRGDTARVLLQKQKERPEPPSSLVPGVPKALDALCMALLSTDPADRPSGSEVLRVLEGNAPAGSGARRAASSSASLTVPFVGRMDELAMLEASFLRARAGRPGAVFVCGESGLGKTALVRRFTQELHLREPNAVVLFGRAHERESVPYQVLDGVIDALSRFMLRLSAEDAALLVPLEASLLAQAFPVLRRVRIVAQAPRRGEDVLDPREMRRRVFGALRELFQRLCARRPVVIVTDDLQWADADGLHLLAAILRSPDAPALFWLATLREDATIPPAAREALVETERVVGLVRRLRLGALPPDDAFVLAERLLGRAFAAGTADPAVIASEAAGHPLFIDALVRHAALGPSGGDGQGAPRLDDALLARVSGLHPQARTLLELTSLHDLPLPLSTAARALGVEGGPQLTRFVSMLRVGQLVRAAGTRAEPCLEPSHDRLRRAVLSSLDGEELRERHEALAVALEGTPHADLEAKATHWHGAGDDQKAAAYAERAADASAGALAFEHAARLYGWALSLGVLPPAETAALRLRYADALVNAGRGLEAATIFERAALGGSGSEALELRRRASEQYLKSGHIDDGVRVIKSLLQDVHEELPPTPAAALRALVGRRLQVRLRGLRFKRREAREVSEAALTRIDLFWSMATTLGLVDPIRGMYFQARHLLLALGAGEPSRVVRALALEAAYSSSGGGRSAPRTARLLAKAEALAAEVGTPIAEAWGLLGRAAAALFEGRFADTLAAVSPCEALLRDRCMGVTWEVSTAQWFGLWAQAYRGELEALAGRIPAQLDEAESRGDLYGASCHRTGLANLVWLAADDPREARAQADRAMEQWSRQGFQVQHWWNMLALGQIALYEGAGALELVDARWPALQASLLLRVQITRIESAYLRGRALVAAAHARPDATRLAELLSRAEKDARRLRGEDRPYAGAFAAIIEAGVLAVKRDEEGATARLVEAERQAALAGMSLHAASARRARGHRIGGEGGRALVAHADAELREQRIKRPERMASVLVPGHDGPT